MRNLVFREEREGNSNRNTNKVNMRVVRSATGENKFK